jgi:hypothetical protein
VIDARLIGLTALNLFFLSYITNDFNFPNFRRKQPACGAKKTGNRWQERPD